MSWRVLVRLLAAYAFVLAALCPVVVAHFTIDRRVPHLVVASVWRAGQLLDRDVLASVTESSARLERAAARPDTKIVFERVEGTSAILTSPAFALAVSFVSGHDGIVATLGDRTAYVTADDLLARQAYDHGVTLPGLGVTLGVDPALVWALLAEALHATPQEVREHATVRRARFARSTPGRPPPRPSLVTHDTLTPDVVRDAAQDLARYLARGIRDDGHFRYLVDAPANRTMPGYDWPRHAGATYFLAQAAREFHEPEIVMACLHAAALMRDSALTTCGDARCIGDETWVDLGSSALALIAFVEIVRSGLDVTYAPHVADLARFIRSQQRPDGEFMHQYDRSSRHPIDVQYVYYSGEATLALARAHGVTNAPSDLDAARRGLAHLVGPAWTFFGDRYYFGEEHWTCQAMADLWGRAPDPEALDFCVRWQRYGRKIQYGAGDSAYDAEGAFGLGPALTPRLTPVASRSEAGIATLEVLRRQRGTSVEANALEAQIRRSLALLVRRQLRPGPDELFADPDAVYGAMPGSEVDLQLRIDYAQHAGSAMIRWIDRNTEESR